MVVTFQLGKDVKHWENMCLGGLGTAWQTLAQHGAPKKSEHGDAGHYMIMTPSKQCLGIPEVFFVDQVTCRSLCYWT